MVDSDAVLSKVKVSDWPSASAGELAVFCHWMELPSMVAAQPSDEVAALVVPGARLKTPTVQPYQKLLRLWVPVFSSVMV